MSWTDADQHAHAARGVVIAAPRSGSGKTVITLGLIAALRARGHAVAAAKTGPDYIDKSILYRAAPAINLDPWAMSAARLRTLAATHAGTGFMHESFDKDDPAKFTRTWFAWVNGLFGELVVKLASERPHLLDAEYGAGG